MNKSNFPVFLIVAGLTIAFILISVLVFLTRGKHSLIKKKLKIGAMLITITGIAATGCETTETTCYVPIPGNQIVIDADSSNGSVIYINPTENDSIRGEIINRSSASYSYRITDSAESEVQSGNITSADNAFDEDRETFYIQVSQALAVGRYSLEFFDKPLSEQNINSVPFYSITLAVINP